MAAIKARGWFAERLVPFVNVCRFTVCNDNRTFEVRRGCIEHVSFGVLFLCLFQQRFYATRHIVYWHCRVCRAVQRVEKRTGIVVDVQPPCRQQSGVCGRKHPGQGVFEHRGCLLQHLRVRRRLRRCRHPGFFRRPFGFFRRPFGFFRRGFRLGFFRRLRRCRRPFGFFRRPGFFHRLRRCCHPFGFFRRLFGFFCRPFGFFRRPGCRCLSRFFRHPGFFRRPGCRF